MEITIEFVNGEMVRQEVDDQTFVNALLDLTKGKVDMSDTRGGKLYDAWATDGYEEFLCKLARDAGATLPDAVVNDCRPHASFTISDNPLAWATAWIVFRLDYGDHETDEKFEWIVTRWMQTWYKIWLIEHPFSVIVENGAIAVRTEDDRYIFQRTHECWPDVLLDEGRAITIGWIDRILKPGDDSSPIYSLLKCPHPYKMIGSQLRDGLANVCEALIHADS